MSTHERKLIVEPRVIVHGPGEQPLICQWCLGERMVVFARNNTQVCYTCLKQGVSMTGEALDRWSKAYATTRRG